MVDAVISHAEEVAACLHTCHTDLYDPGRLLRDHDVLSIMQSDTRAAIERHIKKFPQHSQLYLWRGLDNEAKGNWQEALEDFKLAAKLSKSFDWQPWFRLALLGMERGLRDLAADSAQETLKRLPQFPLKDLLDKVVEARHV